MYGEGLLGKPRQPKRQRNSTVDERTAWVLLKMNDNHLIDRTYQQKHHNARPELLPYLANFAANWFILNSTVFDNNNFFILPPRIPYSLSDDKETVASKTPSFFVLISPSGCIHNVIRARSPALPQRFTLEIKRAFERKKNVLPCILSSLVKSNALF